MDDDNVPNFMKPLKRTTRRQQPNPLESQNQVSPQPPVQTNGQILSQEPNVQNVYRTTSKVEPQNTTQQPYAASTPPRQAYQQQSANNFYANHQNSQSMDSINSINNRQSKQATPTSVKSSPEKTNSSMSLVQEVSTQPAVNFQPPKFTEPQNGVKFRTPSEEHKQEASKGQRQKKTKQNERRGVSKLTHRTTLIAKFHQISRQ